jgi:hypothetical protein
MAKYNIKRRHSKTLDLSTGIRYRPLSRRLDFGGILDYNGKEKGLGWNKASKDALKSSFSDMGSAISSVGSVVGGVTSIVDSAMKNAQTADTTGIESNIQELKDETFSEATDSESLLDAYNSINFQKDNYSMKDIRGVSGGEMAMNTLSAIGSGASAGASVGGPWGAVAGAAVGLGGALAGIFTGNSKARKKAKMLNLAAKDANNRAIDAFDYQADSVMKDNARNAMMAAYAKDGGAIHIKKNNRGKFTASAKRAGMGVQEFARHVLANKDDYSSTLVKRANFARNASKWKHSLGGYMFEDGGNLYSDIPAYQTHGGDFLNGVTVVGAGGTHEDNPYEGVPVGIAPDGQPNLVEEGEVIFNDYVFSNRLHPSDKQLKESRLPNKYKGYTFALIAEDMSKESSERPNDPISQRGLQDSLGKLALLQEQQRMKKGKKGTQQMMAFGGRKYAGPWDIEGLDDQPKYKGWNPDVVDEMLYEQQLIDDAKTGINPDIIEAERAGTLQVPTTKSSTDKPSTDPKQKPLSTFARYAPIVGSAIGALSSVFEKPDYTNSNLILDAANNLSRNRVSSRPINNYLTYKPLDRNYYLSKLQGQAGATRAALRNSGSNPGQVMAGLLAADYNAQNAVGDTLMKMDMYNEQQRQAVEQFNRGTNQYNSQAAMSADAQNAQLASMRDRMRLAGITSAAGMREATDTALANSKSMNLTNFFDNLGAVGQENFIMNQIASNPSLLYYYTNGRGTVGYKNKRGGMLTKRNRRRR